MKNIEEIANLIYSLEHKDDVVKFFSEIFTKCELETLSKRWRILKMLFEGKTQRQIAQMLNVSLCKVTRGSKILKDKDAITKNFLIKENYNEQH